MWSKFVKCLRRLPPPYIHPLPSIFHAHLVRHPYNTPAKLPVLVAPRNPTKWCIRYCLYPEMCWSSRPLKLDNPTILLPNNFTMEGLRQHHPARGQQYEERHGVSADMKCFVPCNIQYRLQYRPPSVKVFSRDGRGGAS